MKLRDVGKLIYVLLICIVVISVLSMIAPDSSTVRLVSVVICTLLLVAAACLWLAFGRCPYCRRLILVSLRNIETCPHCRRNIETGKRKKGKSNRA